MIADHVDHDRIDELQNHYVHALMHDVGVYGDERVWVLDNFENFEEIAYSIEQGTFNTIVDDNVQVWRDHARENAEGYIPVNVMNARSIKQLKGNLTRKGYNLENFPIDFHNITYPNNSYAPLPDIVTVVEGPYVIKIIHDFSIVVV